MEKDNIIRWFKSERVYIILMLACLLALMYVYYAAVDYKDKINNHWMVQLEKCKCQCEGLPTIYNSSINMNALPDEIKARFNIT